ncbi:MAG: RlmE family RNA methyltransferase [Bdellovibrionota bacterium]
MKNRFNNKDRFYKQAKKDGLLARSFYKLEELDKKFSLISPHGNILDMGSAPGSWIQYHLKKIGPKGTVVGVDLNPLKVPNHDQLRFIQGDLYQLESGDFLAFFGPFSCVTSDIAPKTSGDRDRDHEASFQLCEKVLEVATQVLSKGGHLVCKMYQGERSMEFLDMLKMHFAFQKIQRPDATRSQSKEIFFVAKDFLS